MLGSALQTPPLCLDEPSWGGGGKLGNLLIGGHGERDFLVSHQQFSSPGKHLQV